MYLLVISWKETTGTKGTAGFTAHREFYGSVCTHNQHRCSVCGCGCSMGKPNPRVTCMKAYTSQNTCCISIDMHILSQGYMEMDVVQTTGTMGFIWYHTIYGTVWVYLAAGMVSDSMGAVWQKLTCSIPILIYNCISILKLLPSHLNSGNLNRLIVDLYHLFYCTSALQNFSSRNYAKSIFLVALYNLVGY